MFALDLFNNDHERRLSEGAVDQLEQRRIDDLAMKMDDLVARAKDPAYKKNPAALAALMKEFQKCKAERDSYYKVRNETMGYSGLTGESQVTPTATGIRHHAKPENYGGYEPEADPLARLDKHAVNRADKAMGVKFDREKKYQGGLDLDEAGIGQDIVNKTEKLARATPSTPTSKVASTVKNAAKWLAGKGGPGREGPTYEGQDQKKNSEVSDPKIDRLLTRAYREFPQARSDAEALAMKILSKEQNDVDRLDRVNDREDRMIEKLANVEQNLQQQINQLTQPEEVDEGRMGEIDAMRQDLELMNDRQFYTAYGISKTAFQQKYRTLLKPALDEHGGGIGPKQHWQDLMHENKLSVGDPIVVTGPNEFEGKTGEIYEFSPSGAFVIVDLYNHGKHSMHLSDIAYNEYADQEQDEEDDWYDDEDLNEFAPSPERDDDEVPDQILKLANRWWNATDDQPRITNVLRSLGWSIAQVESEDDAVQMQHDDGTTYFISADDFDPDVFEGWSDKMVAQRTGQPRTPYSVYINGKKWKDFENDDHARAVMDKLKAKFKADGRDPETITIAPTDIPEGKGTPVPVKDFVKGVLKDLKKVNVKEEGRVDPILLKALKRMPDGLATHHEVLDAAYDAYAMELGYLSMKGNYGVTNVYIPKLMGLYKDKHGLTFNEAKADPAGSWIVYGGSKVMKFKTHSGAKAYAEKNGGKVASSEFYADKIQKQAIAEFAPSGDDDREPNEEEILRQLAAKWWHGDEDPRAEKALAAMGWSIGQNEGDDEGGVFVVRIGDINGDSFISFPEEELSLDEAQTDYSKRRQRERDVDAGKLVAKQRPSKMTDYQKRRAQDKKDMELGEDQDTSGVERAILNRIMTAHTDLLMKFGPEKVMQAAEEVAYNVGDVDEIGTSDVSAYVHQVKQILGVPEEVNEKWSQKYKSSINCADPKGFSQKAHCAGRKK